MKITITPLPGIEEKKCGDKFYLQLPTSQTLISRNQNHNHTSYRH
jgi:hypothetical protein